ncbi:putative hydrolase of the HAD superfamily [Pedobacter cryoconitis]|uniref:Putative hydrolase of the HAD superfamily n=1 Tax=Pedobacter cryoconitis TaxID=188932 RepID=A0A7W9DZL8_9SPHI|nr:HAD family hydrolase [Pedobacter cryoconitis]MBB5637148.1 putative hydrolase of the HAD superfamily [Pedobacter cryoconitis]MBB6273915.1 putative hydrolase of the HAD superfamily [Pedobacter cryoconitis]
MITNQIQVIAFDADDTLWVNEPYFLETENAFCQLLEEYMPHDILSKELFKTEMDNLSLYGYGIKGFMLCMIETLSRISNGRAPIAMADKIMELGHAMLQQPVILLEGVEEVLKHLRKNYRLVMATKGDLLDQERKLKKSGLQDYFHHIEIMSDKQTADYQKLIKHLDCQPENFLMLGNSIKSDILPVLELGGHAAHIPFHTTWAHEKVTESLEHPNFMPLNTMTEIIELLKK